MQVKKGRKSERGRRNMTKRIIRGCHEKMLLEKEAYKRPEKTGKKWKRNKLKFLLLKTYFREDGGRGKELHM
jgi:hypothetical protein